MIITFCGHSNYSGNLEDEKRLINLLEVVICGNRVDFYFGGYGGFDNFALKCAIIKRNEWMVDQADYLFSYVKTHYGGAYKTLLYAHKHNKRYTNLYQGNYELY